MPTLRFVACLAVCCCEAMIGLFQILAHGFAPRFTAQARSRVCLTARALRIIRGEVAVGALQQFAGMSVPGKHKTLFAGQIEERGLYLLGRKYRTAGTGQLVAFQFLSTRWVGCDPIILGYRHRAVRSAGQPVATTAIGYGGLADLDPFALYQAVGSKAPDPSCPPAFIMAGKTSYFSLLMRRQIVPGDKSR